jgi:hypothetical protein
MGAFSQVSAVVQKCNLCSSKSMTSEQMLVTREQMLFRNETDVWFRNDNLCIVLSCPLDFLRPASTNAV